jgi:RNA polymerase sigma-70 factor, ECF subfamily
MLNTLGQSFDEQQDEQQIKQWVLAASKGESAAFEKLYNLYADTIYRYCAYRVASPAEAEDLTAEVFLRAWQAIGQYRLGNAPFLAWLYRIARNLVINQHNQKAHQKEAADSSYDNFLLENVTASDLESDPVARSIRQIERDTLKLAFRRLNEEYQQVLYWRFIEELSHAEIAQLIGKNEGTVRGIQHRAIQALAKLIDKGVFVG